MVARFEAAQDRISRGKQGVAMTKRRTTMGDSVTRRGTARDTAAVLAEKAPQAMREYLAPFAVEFCDLLMSDARDRGCDGHRTAMGIIPRILRAVGSEDDLIAALLRQTNFGSIGELHMALERGRGSDTADHTDADRQAITWLRSRLMSTPQYRDDACRAVFGFSASEAGEALAFMRAHKAAAPVAVQLTNGHANGSSNGHANGAH